MLLLPSDSEQNGQDVSCLSHLILHFLSSDYLDQNWKIMDIVKYFPRFSQPRKQYTFLYFPRGTQTKRVKLASLSLSLSFKGKIDIIEVNGIRTMKTHSKPCEKKMERSLDD